MHKRNTGLILSYASTAVNMVSGLVLSSFLLRMLGDTEYGIYQTIASFVNYLVLLEFGTGTVMTRNISLCRGQGREQSEIDRNASTVWSITAILALVIAAVAVVFYLSIDVIFSETMTAEQLDHARQIFIVSAGYLVVSFLLQTVNGVILAYEYYSYASAVNIFRSVMKLVLLVVIVLQWHNAVAVAMVDFGLSLICFVCAYLFCTKRLNVNLQLGVLDQAVFRGAAPLCLAIFLQAIVNQANNNVDKFIIGIMLSPENVSLYSVAMYVFSVFSSLTTIPISMYVPAVTKRVAQKPSPDELTDELVEPCRLTALIGGLVLFGFAAVGRQFIKILYGEQYMLAWPIALIIMAPMYLNMVTGVLVNVLDATNKRMVRSVALLLTTLANILLTVVWLDMWGVVGAAMATAVCTFAGQVLLMGVYYSRVMKIRMLKLYRNAFKGILPCLILACLVSFGVGRLITNNWLSFLTGGVIFVLVTMGIYIPVGATDSERNMLRKLLHRGK